MKKIVLAVTTIVLLTGFTKCPAGLTDSSLYENKWYLVNIFQPTGAEVVTGKTSFINFIRENKSAGGNGGCNVFGSTFSVTGNKIRISEIISTEMYCEGIQPTENAFLRQLEKANRYEIKDKILLLYRDKELLLEFVKA